MKLVSRFTNVMSMMVMCMCSMCMFLSAYVSDVISGREIQAMTI